MYDEKGLKTAIINTASTTGMIKNKETLKTERATQQGDSTHVVQHTINGAHNIPNSCDSSVSREMALRKHQKSSLGCVCVQSEQFGQPI